MFRTNEIIAHLPNKYFELYTLSKEYNSEENTFKRPELYFAKSLKRETDVRFVRSLILNKEYRRAKFFLQKIADKNSLECFLYYFSWYLVSFFN